MGTQSHSVPTQGPKHYLPLDCGVGNGCAHAFAHREPAQWRECSRGQRGLSKLNLLLEATALLHSHLPLNTVLGAMLDHAIAITKADRGLLLEADARGALKARLARNSNGESLPAGQH